MPNDIIPLIHNYCDRWCERCVFVHRCEVGLHEVKRWEKNATLTEEEEWKEVADSFKKTIDLLTQMMKEQGIDPAEVMAEELPPIPENIQLLTQRSKDMNRRYFKEERLFFKQNDAYFRQKEREIATHISMEIPVNVEQWFNLGDAMEVVHWYSSMIGAKMNRAIEGLEEQDDWADPLQSDANGSAKVSMICIERSLGAWEIIRQQCPEKTDEIIPFLVKLNEMRKMIGGLFPHWKSFRRPGFDDEPAFARFEVN